MKYAIERRPLFPLGKLVATPGALAALQKTGQSPAEFLSLHVRKPPMLRLVLQVITGFRVRTFTRD